MIDREHSLAPSFALGGATLYRRRAWVFSWLSASFLLVAAASAQTAGEEQGYRKGTETLILQTRQGARHKLVVELAATPAEQSRGLMFRTRLPAKHGMLFLHDPPQKVVMWMKNTYLPLDMLFLDREGRIVQIVEKTTPLSLAQIRSSQPVAAVLQLRPERLKPLRVAGELDERASSNDEGSPRRHLGSGAGISALGARHFSVGRSLGSRQASRVCAKTATGEFKRREASLLGKTFTETKPTSRWRGFRTRPCCRFLNEVGVFAAMLDAVRLHAEQA